MTKLNSYNKIKKGTKNMKAKLALIGCGGIGSYHLGHFVQFTDIIDMVGFCDLIPERAEAFVEKAGQGKAFTDYKEMLDEVKPDMVFICVPPYCHGEIEDEVIKRKIHFFVEKPLALNMELPKQILAKAKAAGLPNDNIKRAIEKGCGAGQIRKNAACQCADALVPRRQLL